MAPIQKQDYKPIPSGVPPATVPVSKLNTGFIKINERDLHQTGIRGTKLVVLVVIVLVLWLLAIATLICNIFLIVRLGIDHRGMSWLQFARNPLTNRTVAQFNAQPRHEFEVLRPNQTVGGFAEKDLQLIGESINLSVNNESSNPDGHYWPYFRLDDVGITVGGVKDFAIVNAFGDVVFDGRYPKFRLPEGGIHSFRSTQIITNRITAGSDESLQLKADTIRFRGMEGNHFNGKLVNIRAANNIDLDALESDGSIVMNGKKGVSITDSTRLPISSSPDLKADILGNRLCVCNNGRLFTVPGNEPCRLVEAMCY